MNTPAKTCPKCGARIPDESRTGICSRCVMGFAFAEPEPETGRQFGKYVLGETVGRGGMGIVYLARTENLDRDVALKMIVGGELASPEAMRRFRAETEAAANLHHPAIVPIHDVGEVDGLPYYTMRFVGSGDLAERIGEFVPGDSREKQNAVAKFLLAVTRAVAYAHEHGVLHRDLKPTNILVDDVGEPLLTDFGLAKRIQDEEAAITLSSSALGSPSYMAPEQTAGESTTASDVWSLGAILYEMLTGEPPFRGKTAMETLRKVVESAPEPPRKTNPQISRDLETVCLKCLEKEPSRRYSSASALADDLERFLVGEPVSARPVGNAALFWRWCRRNPVPAGLAAALLVAIASGVAGIGFQWQRAEEANVDLTDSVRHLEWRQIRTLEEDDRAGQALAVLAQNLRESPGDRIAAHYALSLLQERRFPIAVGRILSLPDGKPFRDLGWDRAGQWIVYHADGREVFVLRGDDGSPHRELTFESEVAALAIEPTGENAAVALIDGSLHQFDPESGDAIASPREEKTVPRELVFCGGDGSLLVVTDRAIRERSTAFEKPSHLLFETQRPITAVHPSRNGGRLLVALPGEAILLERATGRELCRVALPGGADRDLMFSWNGDTFAFRVGDTLRVFDSAGEPIQRLSLGSAPNLHRKFAISPDGSRIAGGNLVGGVVQWAIPSGVLIDNGIGHRFDMKFLGYDREGKRLLTTSSDATARIWEAESGRPLTEAFRQEDYVAEGGFLSSPEEPDTRVLTSQRGLDNHSSYRVWRVPRKRGNRTLATPSQGTIDFVALSRDGATAAVGTGRAGVKLFETASGKETATLFEEVKVDSGLLLPDSKLLLVLLNPAAYACVDVYTGRLLAETVSMDFRALSAAINPGGDRLALGGPGGDVAVWDISDPVAPLPLWSGRHDGLVSSLAFSPDETQLLTTSNDGTAILWNAESGEERLRYRGHEKKILHGVFSPDGTTVATASYDFSAHVWDVGTGALRFDPILHSNQVLHVVFSPDGQLVASGGRNGKIELRTLPDGRRLVDPMQENAGIRWLGFDRDGSRLVSFTYGGVRQWDVATGEPISTVLAESGVAAVGVKGDFTTAWLPGRELLLTSVNAARATLRDLSRPTGEAPEWFADCLEAVSLLRIEDEGVRVVSFDESAETLRRIGMLPGTDPWVAAIQDALGLERKTKKSDFFR